MELKHSTVYRKSKVCSLLIVPYGIETINPGLIVLILILLIVPYGIETQNSLCL